MVDTKSFLGASSLLRRLRLVWFVTRFGKLAWRR